LALALLSRTSSARGADNLPRHTTGLVIMLGTVITERDFKSRILPMLQKLHKTPEELKKGVGVFLKQGEEEEVPVVNEAGEALNIEEIILVGATPEEPVEEEEAPAEEEEITAASLNSAVQLAVDRGLANMKKTGKRSKKAFQITGGDFRNDDKARFGWKTVGEHLTAVRNAAMNLGTDHRLHTLPKGLKATGMSSHVSSDGGFLIPPEFSDRIMDIAHQEDVLFAKTDKMVTTAASTKVNALHETSRAAGSRRGGVRGYWLGEGGTFTGSKPTFRQLTMEPHKLTVLMYATDEQLDDTPNLEQLVSRFAGEEIAFMTGDAIINGTGAGQPLGLLNAGCTVSVAKEGLQGAATIEKENIDKMWARMHAPSRQSAVWLINQDVESELERLAANVGTGGVPVYLPAGGITDTPNSRLKGREVLVTEFQPTLGTVGDIMLVDLSQYLTVTKGDVTSDTSIHVQFTTGETAFRFTFRVDGQPWWSAALTPFKGTNTLSPFISLATRA